MAPELYQVLSYGMRYWFAALGVIIVWRSFRWLQRDRREKHRRLRKLPDAGMIGELLVLQGSDELPAGASVTVPREGVLGAVYTADVPIPAEGV